jgi:phosphocarrier protein
MNGGGVEVQTVQVVNQLGLHARPAAEFVKVANRFQAEVTVEKDGLQVNGKSIMGVLMLVAEQGCRLRIKGDGEDAEEAVRALVDLVSRGFEEE